ncbi:MAG: DNA cytosine methyltransferase [Spirochaetales bacterium]|nr:DNA cytosine methyltransferase [Spirochaetales bacterium]
MRAVDLFCGIGGFRLALEIEGFDIVFSCDIDAKARMAYSNNFGEEPFGDITTIAAESIPPHDLICGGFPCQPFSSAGIAKHRSLERPSGFDDTRGQLYLEILRIAILHRPRFLLLENVRNLLTMQKGAVFGQIRRDLETIGYTIHVTELEASLVVPQRRPRIYIVCFRNPVDLRFYLKALCAELECLPLPPSLTGILDSNPDPSYTLPDKLWTYLQAHREKHRKAGNGFGFSLADPDGVARTLSARYYKDGSEILIPGKDGANPRRMTPRECARLMGFPDSFHLPESDQVAYKLLGNAVVPPIIQILLRSLPVLRSIPDPLKLACSCRSHRQL